MAYCVFTNCLSILGSGITPYTSLDSRSGCGMTTSVGQAAFFGSSDNIGPLGVVIQHVCGNGVCRVDFTSTRYGISGNDLSLNVDAADPNTGGGLYIKYRGNVGIGTSSPDTRLHIRNCVNGGTNNFLLTLQNTCTVSDARAGIAFLDNENTVGSGGISGASIQASNNGVDGAGSLLFSTLLNGAVTERMRMTSAGNVGIGTTSPSSRLDVCGADGRIQSRVDSSDGSTINVRPNAGKCGWISYTEDAVADRWGIGIKNGDAKLYFSSGNVGVGGGTTRMVLDGSGNVGMGTPSPSYRLHVCRTGNSDWLSSFENTDGTESVSTYISHGNGYGIAIDSSENDSKYIFKAMAGTGGGGGKGSVPVIWAQHNGLVGIGTLSPIDKLEVAGGIHTSGTASASKACTGYLDYYVGQVRLGITGPNTTSPAIFRIDQYSSNASIYCTPFYITATSNIGVNTTSPSYRLHVNGTFYAAGSSIKYKEGICNYDTNSCLFMCLKPVTYQYKDEFKHLGKELKSETQIGLIAEHVAEVMPELAILVNEEDEKVVRNVDYEKLSIILLSEVQKLRKEVDQLKQSC